MSDKPKELQENQMARQCIVTLDSAKIDVVARYRRCGYTILPPILTMTKAELIEEAGVSRGYNPAYGFYLERGTGYVKDDYPVRDGEALGLEHGMCFYTVPPATMSPRSFHD